MTADTKQLEGLGKLLKAAGVKPSGVEAMVRDHLDEIQDDARQHHAELIAAVKILEAELIELRHHHASSVSEIRIATDLMRREIEGRSITFDQTLHLAKFVLIVLISLQIMVIVSLQSTMSSSTEDISSIIPAIETAYEPEAPEPNSVPAPAPTSSPQGAPSK